MNIMDPVPRQSAALKGFTFIEILVVVTIIAILITVGMVSYTSVNARSRDARRKSDIEQIRTALEMYRADFGYYPDPTGLSSSFFAIASDSQFTSSMVSYLPSVPTDPKDNTKYPYQIQMTNYIGAVGSGHYYGYCIAAFTEAIGSGGSTCAALPTASTGEVYTYGTKQP